MDQPADIIANKLQVFAPKGRKVLLRAEVVTLPAGKVTAIVGPNGAGKSSFLRAIGGMLPSEGELSLGNFDLHEISAQARSQVLAIQPQGALRAEGLSVKEAVAASLGAQVSWFSGISRAEHARVDEVLERCGASEFSNRMLATLSGGEAAKVALAATLVGGAKSLLLDEPAAALDPGAAHALRAFLTGLVREKSYSIAIVEHDLAAARSIADHLVLIADGVVVDQGEPSAVLEEKRLSEVYGAEMRFIPDGNGGFALSVRGEVAL